ncbi:hypothetical protein BH23BAC1_BH23BAC1_12340 [soil metagenome]
MDVSTKTILWQQTGASIDMLENAMIACPVEYWNTNSKFWYISYHTLFYLDYYSSDPENFSPPEPFTLSELDPEDKMPDRVYDKEELLNFLKIGREKCYRLIAGLTAESAEKSFINERKNYSILEMIIYNMRHVQHHAAQLNLLLRQNINEAPRWISRSDLKL